MHDGFTACPFALHIEPATIVTVDVCPLVWEHILKYKVQAGYLYLQSQLKFDAAPRSNS
jgi:hypothetical protein